MAKSNGKLRISPQLGRILVSIIDRAQPKKHRTIRQFAEEEIVLPNGPHVNKPFRGWYQPFAGLWLDTVDNATEHGWNRFVVTGCVQSGKTLLAWVIPILYHLFELDESVIAGVPRMKDATDKWREDLFPVLEKTRYIHLMPRVGSGSKGGQVNALTFKNGATLKFMSGKGGDEERSGFTARVLVATEIDKYDERGTLSRETNKLNQMEARTKAFGDRKRVYLECTTSIEQGRTWLELQSSTNSRIVLRCPHCGAWVTPEREDLLGWQEADSRADAEHESHIVCPDCKSAWTEQQRRDSNHAAKVVHDGQKISKAGRISGKPGRTRTFGFRWNAVNNLFVSSAEVGGEEWHYARQADRDSAERYLLQFVWTKPYSPPEVDLTSLDPWGISKRTLDLPRGIVPDTAEAVTIGVDIRSTEVHWVAIAWSQGASGHIFDYGVFLVPSQNMALELAVLSKLKELYEMCEAGWRKQDNTPIKPDLVFVDSGWQGKKDDPDFVYQFCEEVGAPYLPIKGYGSGQFAGTSYLEPDKVDMNKIAYKGGHYHITRSFKNNRYLELVRINADHWKTFFHERLKTPMDKPGAITLYKPERRNAHLSLARHFTAERQVQEFQPMHGYSIRWVHESGDNHWLDCAYMACCASDHCGISILGEPSCTEPEQVGEEYFQAQGVL